MQKKPNLYDLWREFRFFANVNDRKYHEHLDFFIEAKAGRFFTPKAGQRRTILLSSLRGLDEELETVQKYIFWKRRTPRVKKLTPKAILMASKNTKKRSAKSPSQTSLQSPAKTPTAPSSSSTPVKVGVCKSLALPTIALKEYRSQIKELGMGFLFWRWDYSADTLVKEFATAKSEVNLPHRGKPFEWTIAHWRKALGRSDEDDEGGMVWDAQVARLTMPEGVNREELFSEKRPNKDKNGYKTRSYIDPFKKVLAETLMALFCPARTMYLVTHKVAFIERVVRKEKLNWGAVFAQHVLHSLKTVNDGNPVYVGAFLVHLYAKNGWLTEGEKKIYGEDHPSVKNIADYSSDEGDTSSDEEEQEVAPRVLAKDTEDEDEDEGTPRPQSRGVQFTFEYAIRKPKSPTSPNYSPQGRDEDEDEGQDKGKQLLDEGVEVEIQEEHARLTSSSPSCAMTVENLTKYLMPTFAAIEDEGRLMYKEFEAGHDHLNAATKIIPRARIFGENAATEFKLRTLICKQKDEVREGNKTIDEQEDTIDRLEKDKKELQDVVKTKDEHMKKLESEFEALKIAKATQDEEMKAKDTKITNLQVQWIERREVEEKDAAIGSLRDSLKEIYEAMKTDFPSKDEKKSRLQKLADRTKRDYEGILREYRDDFGEFKRRLLSKTDAPTTSGRSS
ncbi:hypothetical protein R1sor_021502 [Riccia sorocarpa]|uniref:Uncharacterized protein n=1 Tax=Riccia sorocarpa TaxID=122646 RepID=A0ABD3GIP7_9MARC